VTILLFPVIDRYLSVLSLSFSNSSSDFVVAVTALLQQKLHHDKNNLKVLK